MGVSEEAAHAASATSVATADVVVTNPQGLHLRPATQFARLVQGTGCRVLVTCGGQSGDGASVLELAMMAIRPGSRLTIEATGVGCESTVRALVALVEANFEA